MKKSIVLLALFSGIGLAACDQSPDTVVVPVPGPAGATGAPGQSGDEGIQGQTGRSGDTGIQGETGETGGDTTIIIPPPAVETPADSTTPAN